MISQLRFNKVGALFTASILFAVFLLISILGFNAFAQQEAGEDAVTLGISPLLLEVTANPGEKITNTFRLTNGSDQDLEILTTPKNFTPSGEEGNIDLTEDDTSYAIASWTSVSPQSRMISARSTEDFEVTINVPENAEPGSHFGSVVFSTVPPEDDEAAALISQEIAPVILVRLAGDVVESAEIEEFKSDKSFYSNEPVIEFLSRIKNTGSVHFKPTGQIVVKNMFGSEVAKFDLTKQNVLPNSIRQITNEWTDSGYLVGKYTAELTIVVGEDNQIQKSTYTFYVFPYQTLLPIIIGVVLLIFILYKGRRRIKLAAKALSGADEKSASKDE